MQRTLASLSRSDRFVEQGKCDVVGRIQPGHETVGLEDDAAVAAGPDYGASVEGDLPLGR